MSVSDEELASWSELCERASAGPWVEDDGHVHSGPLSDAAEAYVMRLLDDPAFAEAETDNQINRPWHEVAHCSQEGPNFEADAQFIATARTAFPALLAEVKRLRELEAELDRSELKEFSCVPGSAKLTVRAPAVVGVLVSQLDAWFLQNGAKNNMTVSASMGHDDTSMALDVREYTLTVQRRSGKTPAEQRDEARAELAKAREEVAEREGYIVEAMKALAAAGEPGHEELHMGIQCLSARRQDAEAELAKARGLIKEGAYQLRNTVGCDDKDCRCSGRQSIRDMDSFLASGGDGT